MHPFENIMFPSILNTFNVDKRSELIMLWNVLYLNNYFDWTCTLKTNCALAEFLPFSELPFHINHFVFFKSNVFPLNHVCKNLIFSSHLCLWNAWWLCKLTEKHLFSKSFVNNMRWTVENDFNFSLLTH